MLADSDAYPTIGVDWAGPRGVYWTADGQQVQHDNTLIDLLGRLPQPTRIVLEPAFESFEPNKREEFIAQARAAGHRLERVSDRMTPRTRRALGFPQKGASGSGRAAVQADDEYDARTIWHLAHTKHCSPVHAASELDPAWNDRFDRLHRAAVVTRFTGGKPAVLAEIERVIGPASDLPDWVRPYLVDKPGKRYRAFVATAWLAAREANSRNEFERFMGLYQNGRASMLRSEAHHWGWRAIHKTNPDATLSEFRKALRYFYARAVDTPQRAENIPA